MVGENWKAPTVDGTNWTKVVSMALCDPLYERSHRHDQKPLSVLVCAFAEFKTIVAAEEVVEAGFSHPVENLPDYAALFSPEFSAAVDVGKELRYAVKSKDEICASHMAIAPLITACRSWR